MASLQWITVNNRLEQGVILINQLTHKKFHLLLTHIQTSPNDQFFSDDEQLKLQDSLKLDEADLHLLLQSIAYINKQSRKVILKPTELQKQLIEIGLDKDKAEIFTKEWSKEFKDELGEFDERYQLEGVKWEVNMQTASDLGNRQTIPNARIQLNLANMDNGKDTAVLELGEEDLQQIYNTLEIVQLRLDNLSKK